MKRSTRPRKTANLSKSIHRRLNMYAHAASAAGVGMLALIPAAECVLSAGAALAGSLAISELAEAKIVYTATNVVMQCTEWGCRISDSLDLNHDGIPDVEIIESFNKPGCFFWARPANGNGIEGRNDNALALKAGAAIGGTKPFVSSARVIMRDGTHSGHSFGYWNYAQNRFLGVKFQIMGRTHYGWARFKDSSCRGATLTGYAYETIPNKPIIAGKTKGPDVVTVQPGSLGALAAGRN